MAKIIQIAIPNPDTTSIVVDGMMRKVILYALNNEGGIGLYLQGGVWLSLPEKEAKGGEDEGDKTV